jgi:hypothetical protein
MIVMNSGSIIANSTALAPRVQRKRLFIVDLKMLDWMRAFQGRLKVACRFRFRFLTTQSDFGAELLLVVL